ncbi:hypothetical protein SAMN05216516_101467 [Izhakiella capsodis]|uniref:Protein nucleotidyltransferase YdiU n=1 Tax=Izhakiella capsodis TaxID=1367852 RepID=A0A1I4V090_9GAMM|nr:YdiU family protein [Izhakiella capsodis]SFM94689.1 hypothetical protein SAMN05216516_101467 [Izhakiella capsodis]
MRFDNSWFNELRGSYTALSPTPLHGARLLYYSRPMAKILTLDDNYFSGEQSKIWCGDGLITGMQPLAQVYSGHQFGEWAGQLGDGRGILLGEQRLPDGRKFDWHLKGAGLTPYSRMGDGRAVLRSTIREFLASEAIHALGIPTTRALTIVTSDEPVQREQTERGAMLLRVAESHLRFGHFEHFHSAGKPEKVRELADYAIRHHWSQLADSNERYLLWFTDIVRRTARLIALWQSCGFAHGVMNTDNMSLLGLTLDYGPYRFMDDYQPGLMSNHSDYQGRYAFNNQPTIGLWNLNRLAYALSSLMRHDQLAQALSTYEPTLLQVWGERMRARLGLMTASDDDNRILTELLALMAKEGSDYTRVFRRLSETEQQQLRSPLRDEFIDRAAFDSWYQQYRQRLLRDECDDLQRQRVMKAINPALVLRNYLAQQAIEKAEKDDISELTRLHQALLDPFNVDQRNSDYLQPPPSWGKTLEVSCSS